MGSQQFYPDEGPVHDEQVEPLRSSSILSPMPSFQSSFPTPVT